MKAKMYLATEAKILMEVMIKMGNGDEKKLKDREYGLPIPPQEDPYATVGLKGSATVNLGNFNSGRIEISIFYPCQPDKVNEVYEQIKDWVDERLSAEYNELKKHSQS